MGAEASLPISLSAMADAQHPNRLAVLMEPHTVVADPEAILRWVDALQFLYAAGAGVGEALDGPFDAACDALVERRHMLQRRLRSTRPLSLQAEPPHGLIVRNAFAAVAG